MQMKNVFLQCLCSPSFGAGVFLIVTGFLFWDRPFDPPTSALNINWTKFNHIEFNTGYRSRAYSIRIKDYDDADLFLLSSALNTQGLNLLVEFVNNHHEGHAGWFDKCENWAYSLKKSQCKVLLVLDSKNERVFHFDDSVKELVNEEQELIHRLFYMLPYISGLFFVFLSILLSVIFNVRNVNSNCDF